MFKLVPAVVDAMSRPYPELLETKTRVAAGIQKEEASFFSTIDAGLSRIEQVFRSMKSDHRRVVDGQVAAELYQTYGIPAELVESMASEQGLEFDWDGYREAMSRHSQESGIIHEGVMGSFGPVDEIKAEIKSTPFVGYEQTECSSRIVALVVGDERVQSIGADNVAANPSDGNVILVLDQSPFYGEAGGQVGDCGEVRSETGTFAVVDTQRDSDLILHYGHMLSGTISSGQSVWVAVDKQRRAGIRRAHSATHLLHFALQKHLGRHAQQRGSKVDDDWLRFDFTNQDIVSAEKMAAIECEIQQRIADQSPIAAQVLPLGEARKVGAMMLFGEKYPDPVRMISIGDFSRELCGGTHLSNSSEIQSLEILAEEGVSAGTRRIVALTGLKADEHAQHVRELARQLTRRLNCTVSELPATVATLLRRIKALKKQLASGQESEVEEPLPSRKGSDAETLDYRVVRDAVREVAKLLNVGISDTLARVDAMLAETTTIERQLADLQQSSGLDADDLIKSAELLDSTLLIVRELPGANASSNAQPDRQDST